MKVSNLANITKILSRISNQSSLTALYRSIELDKNTIRCCSEFGNVAITTDDTGLTHPILLETTAVQGVAQSLPSNGEVEFTEKENKLNWKCGRAKGHWNVAYSEHKIPDLVHSEFPWTPDPNLAQALSLASAACQAAAVSVGLYGITMEACGEDLFLLSSNSISLACAKIPKGTFPTNKITVRPPVPAIISILVSQCPECTLDITDEGIFIKGQWLKAHLPLAVPLEHDLKALVGDFQGQQHTAKINADEVRKFINRARSLSDKNASFTIALKVEEGQLVLTHTAIASGTEEVFLADGLDKTLNYASVAMPADMLLVSLAHVETAIFDYLDKSQLVLRGINPDYCYVMGGGDS